MSREHALMTLFSVIAKLTAWGILIYSLVLKNLLNIHHFFNIHPVVTKINPLAATPPSLWDIHISIYIKMYILSYEWKYLIIFMYHFLVYILKQVFDFNITQGLKYTCFKITCLPSGQTTSFLSSTLQAQSEPSFTTGVKFFIFFGCRI